MPIMFADGIKHNQPAAAPQPVWVRYARHAAGMLVLMFSCATLVGCGPPSSLIVKGQRVKTGKRNYDNYFEEVTDLSEKIDALDSDMFPLRQPLTEILDVDVDASLPTLLVATKKRAAKLKDYGVTANLHLNSNPTVLIERGELREDEKDEALFKAVQESATRGMATYREYSLMLEELVELDEKRGKLADKVDRLGPKHPARGRIESELVGAGKVLAKAERKLLTDTRTITHFMVGLADAIDTGALEQREAACEQAIADASKPSWRRRKRGRRAGRKRTGGRRGGARRGGARPKPRPAPRPAPAGGGDFDM